MQAHKFQLIFDEHVRSVEESERERIARNVESLFGRTAFAKLTLIAAVCVQLFHIDQVASAKSSGAE